MISNERLLYVDISLLQCATQRVLADDTEVIVLRRATTARVRATRTPGIVHRAPGENMAGYAMTRVQSTVKR